MSTKTFWFFRFLEYVTKYPWVFASNFLNNLFIIPKTFWFSFGSTLFPCSRRPVRPGKCTLCIKAARQTRRYKLSFHVGIPHATVGDGFPVPAVISGIYGIFWAKSYTDRCGTGNPSPTTVNYNLSHYPLQQAKAASPSGCRLQITYSHRERRKRAPPACWGSWSGCRCPRF